MRRRGRRVGVSPMGSAQHRGGGENGLRARGPAVPKYLETRRCAGGDRRSERVAHQYQIAGGKVSLRIATELAPYLDGVGRFKPGAEYAGVGRVSTGLGCPHPETSSDFLGLRLAFVTDEGHRVDFIPLHNVWTEGTQ
jgi:hypothetical protein